MDKFKFETPDGVEQNIERIAELFPNCVTEMSHEEGKVKRGSNIEMLEQTQTPEVMVAGES